MARAPINPPSGDGATGPGAVARDSAAAAALGGASTAGGCAGCCGVLGGSGRFCGRGGGGLSSIFGSGDDSSGGGAITSGEGGDGRAAGSGGAAAAGAGTSKTPISSGFGRLGRYGASMISRSKPVSDTSATSSEIGASHGRRRHGSSCSGTALIAVSIAV